MLRITKNNTALNGFTLVELLVAIVVSTVLVGATALAITNLVALNGRARSLALSNASAQNKVEELRSAGYLSLSNGTYNFTSELPAGLKAPRVAEYTVSDVSTGLKQIDIAITYNDEGQPRTVNYATYIGELGVGQY